MIANKLATLKVGDCPEEGYKPTEEVIAGQKGHWSTAKTLVLKIDVSKRRTAFEEALMIAFLKEAKLDFKLEVCEVPVFRECKLY